MSEELKSEKRELKSDVDPGVKVTIGKNITEKLWELVEKVNDGFEAGRVHRQDVATWIIERFLKSYSESDVIQIRQAHYSEASMLEAAFKKMKETGQVPEYLRVALREQFYGDVDANKLSSKRTRFGEVRNKKQIVPSDENLFLQCFNRTINKLHKSGYFRFV